MNTINPKHSKFHKSWYGKHGSWEKPMRDRGWEIYTNILKLHKTVTPRIVDITV